MYFNTTKIVVINHLNIRIYSSRNMLSLIMIYDMDML